MAQLRSLARFTLLALLATPAAAWAAGGSRSVIVFVGAEDRGAENMALKLGQLVEEAVGRNAGHSLTSLQDAAGDRLPPDARAARKQAEDDLAAGKKAYAEGQLDTAAQSLQTSIREFEAAASALDKVDGYAEAHAYLGAVLQLQHKDDDARDALTQALIIRPNLKLDPKLANGPVADLLRTARHDANEGHRGSVSLQTTPTGGRVYVDGELRGFAPLTIDRLPVGKHLFRFERPGYFNAGQVSDVVSTNELALKGHFTPTKDFAEVEDAVGQALKEVDGSSAGPNTMRLLKRFNADRGIFANVRTTGDNLVLDLALVDGKAKKRIAHRRNSLEGEDPANLQREVGRLVGNLFADADESPSKASKSSNKDPLDSVSGMEDWDDDKGSARKSRSSSDDDDHPRKKKSSDDE